jgi:predicted ATPase/DNA-binding CsgD family transcriptional regulator
MFLSGEHIVGGDFDQIIGGDVAWFRMIVEPSAWPSGRLPAEITGFVGRRHEVSEVKRLLSHARLVTLTGIGGVGKTRLALHVAAKIRRAFPDGVYLVDLAPLQDEELLVRTVAAALGLPDQSARPPLERLAEHLEDKRLLLVLDNCEHLLDSCAVLTGKLLGAAAGLRILATSRQALRIGGECTLTVQPLSVPPESQAMSSADLGRYEAIQLFVERARAVQTDFAVTVGNWEAVLRICQQLEGIPLAIELAAVRLRILSPAQIVERLHDRFRLLTAGSRTAPPRQRTLRAAIDWSCALCSAHERTLWARLSVFAGSFDLDAAEQVCAGDGVDAGDVFELVAGLVDKSILSQEDHGVRVRYRLLETLRQYGAELLAASDRESAARARHRDYYLSLAEQADVEWISPRQVEWIERLSAESPNLRVALQFSLRHPGQVELGLRMAAALGMFWIAAGSLQEARRWLYQALELNPAATVTRAKTLCTRSFMDILLGDFRAADSAIEESRELAEHLGDAAAAAYAAEFAGVAAIHRGDLDVAAALLDDALAKHRANNDLSGLVMTAGMMVQTVSFLGDISRYDLAQETVLRCEENGAEWSRSWALWGLGLVMWREREHKQAARQLRAAIRLKQSFDDLLGTALCVEGLAWITADAGQAEDAARLLGIADTVWRRVGSPFVQFGHFRRLHDDCESAIRQQVGDEAYVAAFNQAGDLKFERAIAYAVGDKWRGKSSASRAEDESLAGLTAREKQVAELVARGLSNKDIAAKLIIAQRTAEAHVEHILIKLGFNSRAQISAWVTEHHGVIRVSAEDSGIKSSLRRTRPLYYGGDTEVGGPLAPPLVRYLTSAVPPPSMTKSLPTAKADSSDARKTTNLAIS